VHVWNAATAQDIHGFYSDAALPMRAVAFAPTGNMLAVGGDDGIVRIWNGLTCTLNGTQCKDVPQRFTITTAAIRALAWSPDGQYLAVGTNDGLTVLLKPGSGTKPIFTANAHTNVRSLTWSPDGQKLAVAYGNLVSIWTMQGL
jgi:WD40 repeat protein